ncbi:MAG: methionine biosynthesis protein MetW [Gammaproteobacteria bacterium]
MHKNIETHILSLIPRRAKVLDLGSGDGSLLAKLAENNIEGHGIEIDSKRVIASLCKGVSVTHKDIDKGLLDFQDLGFDFVVMANSIQCLRRPHEALTNIFGIANECAVTIPNFGFWKIRMKLLKGSMPVSKSLPAKWYETKNIHLCTIQDFEKLCLENEITIKKRIYLNENFKPLNRVLISKANLFAAEAIYHLEKK